MFLIWVKIVVINSLENILSLGFTSKLELHFIELSIQSIVAH